MAEHLTVPGPRLNIKTVFTSMGISIKKIIRSQDRLMFIVWIPILVRHLYIETGPRLTENVMLILEFRHSFIVYHRDFTLMTRRHFRIVGHISQNIVAQELWQLNQQVSTPKNSILINSRFVIILFFAHFHFSFYCWTCYIEFIFHNLHIIDINERK